MDRIAIKILEVYSPVSYLIENQIPDEKLLRLEEDIRLYFEKVSKEGRDDSERIELNDVCINNFVVAYLPEENKCVRGLFKNRIRRGNGINYVIKLVDYSISITTNDSSTFKKLPEKYIQELTFRTAVFTLPNLEPINADLRSDLTLCFSQGDSWSESSLRYCSKLISKFKWEADAVITHINSPYSYEGRLYFGNIHCMNELLDTEKYATSTVQSVDTVESAASNSTSFVTISSSSESEFHLSNEHNFLHSKQLTVNSDTRSNNATMPLGETMQGKKLLRKPSPGMSTQELLRLKASKKSRNTSSEESVPDTGNSQNFTVVYSTHQTKTSESFSSPSSHSSTELAPRYVEPDAPNPFIVHPNQKQNASSSLDFSKEVQRNDEPIRPQLGLQTRSLSNDNSGCVGKSDYCNVFSFGHKLFTGWEIEKFGLRLKQALKNLGINAPKPLQKYSWPAVNRGLDVVLIGDKKSGKSLSFMLPLFWQLLSGSLYDHMDGQNGSGPVVLILCESFESVNTLYNLCMDILQQDVVRQDGTIHIIKINKMKLTQKEKGELINGCEILISIPAALLDLLAEENSCIKLNRLLYYVFEDADKLFDSVRSRKIINIFKHQEKSGFGGKMLEMPKCILCSKIWTKDLKLFCDSKKVNNPVIYMADLLEASFFTNMEFDLITTSTLKKNNELIDLLHGQHEKKTVVFADTDNVYHLRDVLKTQSFSVLSVRNGMSRSQITAAARNWQWGSVNYIMVIDDMTYDEIRITDAKRLIHYDLPSKQLFCNRFNVLMGEMQSAVAAHSGNLKEPIQADCSTHVIVTENDIHQANFFKQCLERWGIGISPKLAELAKKRAMEKENPTLPICNTLKTFGKCVDRMCKYRHLFYADENNVLHPDSGSVMLKVIKVMCANHYYAHIINYGSSSKKIMKHYHELDIRLQSHFLTPENRIPLKTPCVGTVAAIKNLDDSYSRVKIVYKDGETVIVWHLETAQTESVNAARLLILPEHYQLLAPQAVEIILANVQPMDESFVWQHDSNRFVASLIRMEECEGKILKTYDNILWLESLRKIKQIMITKQSIVEFSLPKKLIAEKLAIHNPDHMRLLDLKFQLLPADIASLVQSNAPVACPENSIFNGVEEEETTEGNQNFTSTDSKPNHNSHEDVVNEEKPESIPQQIESKSVTQMLDIRRRLAGLRTKPKPKFSTAKLELNTIQSVFVPFVESPALFYVQRDADRLDDLNEEINSSKLEALTDTIKIGDYYLAPFSCDKTYFRAQAISLLPNNQVKMFCLDVGDTAVVSIEELRILEKRFLEKLPFQAICCKMADIGPQNGNSWCGKATDEFRSHVINEADDAVELFLLATSALKPEKFRYPSYEVVLFNFERTVILNELLVEKGVAVQIETDFSEYRSFLVFDSQDSAVYTDSDTSGDNPGKSLESVRELSVPARILWYETQEEVVLKVVLSDVNDYVLNVYEQQVEFYCQIRNGHYYNQMDLFAPVDKHKYAATVYPKNVIIRLPKSEKKMWHNLMATKKMPIWLKYDMDHLVVTDSEDERNERLPCVLKPKKTGKFLPIPPRMSDSSSCEDSDLSS